MAFSLFSSFIVHPLFLAVNFPLLFSRFVYFVFVYSSLFSFLSFSSPSLIFLCFDFLFFLLCFHFLHSCFVVYIIFFSLFYFVLLCSFIRCFYRLVIRFSIIVFSYSSIFSCLLFLLLLVIFFSIYTSSLLFIVFLSLVVLVSFVYPFPSFFPVIPTITTCFIFLKFIFYLTYYLSFFSRYCVPLSPFLSSLFSSLLFLLLLHVFFSLYSSSILFIVLLSWVVPVSSFHFFSPLFLSFRFAAFIPSASCFLLFHVHLFFCLVFTIVTVSLFFQERKI